MVRRKRALSDSGFYHVMLRGDGHRLLFEDDDDRRYFKVLLHKRAEKYNLRLIAWCLMSNHIHLLVEDEEGDLSRAMMSLESGYARYLNDKTGRSGHVFEDGFKSECISSDAQLLDTIRYIHFNPERKGVALHDEYPWSSYHEYVGEPEITDTGLVLDMFGSVEGFVRYSNERHTLADGERFSPAKMTDEEAALIAKRTLGGKSPSTLASLDKPARNAALQSLRDVGISAKRLARLTGIGEATIYRYTHK